MVKYVSHFRWDQLTPPDPSTDLHETLGVYTIDRELLYGAIRPSSEV